MKVLVTGAGALLGQGIIKALKRSSLNPRIVAVDPSPLSAGLYWSDSAHLVPLASSPGYLKRMREILALEKPDALLVGTDVELRVFAEARQDLKGEFGVEVLVSRPAAVQIADDKWLTSEFLRKAGLGYVPSCLPGSHMQFADEVGFPLVVKPRIGARSVGMTIVHDRTELERGVEGRPGVVVQKLVGRDDTEYTAGTLTFAGKCNASIVMRRDLRDGNTYRAYSDSFPELNRQMRLTAERLDAYGPANFQFRLEDGTAKIFEINCRFSGTTPLRAHAGFNEVEMALRHVLRGEPVMQPEVRPLVLLRHWEETVVESKHIIDKPAQRSMSDA